VLIEGTGHTRAEIARNAEYEMVTKLEGFLRRRSKIAQVVQAERLDHASRHEPAQLRLGVLRSWRSWARCLRPTDPEIADAPSRAASP
jgi:hypothetical protein